MGLCGILGGLVLFAGDMLFYYDSSSTDPNLNMGNASDTRIVYSGISALIATWLYMIGLGQVYYAFKPATTLMRNIVIACFTSILISYGIVHAAYIAIATTAKLAVENDLDMETATRLSSSINETLRWFVYPIFALLSYLFISQVWKRRSLYPRWIILFFPLIPFLLQDLIGRTLSGALWVVIMGGYLNLILVVFFTASTISLWKTNNNPTQ